MFKVFEQRSVELLGAFKIWHGKLFPFSTVQKPDWRRFEKSKRDSLKGGKKSATAGEKRGGVEGVERRGKEWSPSS